MHVAITECSVDYVANISSNYVKTARHQTFDNESETYVQKVICMHDAIYSYCLKFT